MSQHSFDTIHNGERACVILGWDAPLQGFFMFIEKDTDTDEPFWSNLNYHPSHPKDLKVFLDVLEKLKIVIPPQMINELMEDKKNNAGNKQVAHFIKNNEYLRQE